MIYCVEDERNIRELLIYTLETTGFSAKGVSNGKELRALLKEELPDLILLDIMLPGEDGYSILERLKASQETKNIPVIMVTAKEAEFDKVRGLEAGADDYVVKPFEVVELMARIKARLRTLGMGASSDGAAAELPEFLHCGILEMNRVRHTAKKNGIDLHLTPMEFELLYVLAVHEDEPLSRTSLLKQVWGYDDGGDAKLVNVHVQRLRMKVESNPEKPQIVQTVRGIGYKFVAPTE